MFFIIFYIFLSCNLDINNNVREDLVKVIFIEIKKLNMFILRLIFFNDGYKYQSSWCFWY
jgi:hypothetical protein